MKRRAIFVLFSLVFLGSFVSAYFGNSYGNGLSFQNLFSNTNPSLVFSLLFFLILFVFFNYSLSRVFVENQMVPKVISLSLSTGIIYWMNISNNLPVLNLGSFFSGVGLPENFLFTLAPLLFFGVLIYLIFKLKRKFFLIFGILLLILGLFKVVYESGASIVLGVLFLLIWFWRRRARDPLGDSSGEASRLNSRQTYKQELRDRRYQEKIRQSQIKARARNILGIRRVREKRNRAREQRINKKNKLTSENNLEEIETSNREIIYKKRQRSLYDLKQRYMAYLFSYYSYRNNPRKQKRIKQTMNVIIKMAKKQGCEKSKFLSNKIGGRNAKAPENLK